MKRGKGEDTIAVRKKKLGGGHWQYYKPTKAWVTFFAEDSSVQELFFYLFPFELLFSPQRPHSPPAPTARDRWRPTTRLAYLQRENCMRPSILSPRNLIRPAPSSALVVGGASLAGAPFVGALLVGGASLALANADCVSGAHLSSKAPLGYQFVARHLSFCGASRAHRKSKEMEDEYKTATGPPPKNYTSTTPLTLENNTFLPSPTITYNTYGSLDDSRSNCIVVCHALTGNTQLETWWDTLIGKGRPLDTDKYFVVGVGLIGTVNGETSGPRTIRESSGRPWGKDFPDISVRDSVNQSGTQ